MSNSEVARKLESALGADKVSVRGPDLTIYSRDVWPRNTIRVQALDIPDRPVAVVWPESEEEVAVILKVAREANEPVIPMGAGSGVCGGTSALGGRGIILDLKRMNRIIEIDDNSLTVTAEAGIVGEVLERRLNEKGYTMGHFPSSIYCSSYGGWLATRAAGQLSARYGKIEDMVVSLRAVLADGSVHETGRSPRPVTGPDLNQAFVGAEGTMGVITSATCRIWPYPESRRFQAYSFETVADGFEAIRRMMQADLHPACVRLYDPVDTFFSKTSKIMPAEEEEEVEKKTPFKKYRTRRPKDPSGWKRKLIPYIFAPNLVNPFLGRLDRSKLILTFEGDPEVTQLEKNMARGICATCGGEDLGEGPAKHWWEKRYKVSYTMQVVFNLGLFVDTIEVATVWDNLPNLYYGMRSAIGRHAFVMAHFSHAYPQGCSIYFSIASTGRSVEDKLKVYDRVWKDAMDACIAHGGSISHHHGVGVLKAKWMDEEYGGSTPMLKALKSALDPDGLLNPGKLGL